ncbi:hypothetical protein HLB35_04085 [Halomonas sp. TBZ9]|uniref:FAD/FMN-containing dehydrogenase n=1 Tax=Vreelandella azerica TaxID=2732867 RepID=A0A7Y3TVY1_9GAMM|nr:hypothetical protein [Halomonas azerica]NOG31148.1 hypothetical protein [Halomonas azerica]
MRFVLFALALFIAPLSLAQGETTSSSLQAGDTFPSLQLPDAFGNVYQLPYPGVRHVLFSADMDANDLMEQSFGELDKGDFTAAGLVYVADISGMPRLVARLFAIPSLRDYPFRVLLARDAEQLAMLPRQEGAVSVISLSQDGEIEKLDFVSNEAGLKELVID